MAKLVSTPQVEAGSPGGRRKPTGASAIGSLPSDDAGNGMNRRSLVAALIGAALLATTPTPAGARGTGRSLQLPGIPWRNGNSARIVGRCYLALAPEERDVRLLMQTLLGRRRLDESPDALHRKLARMRERDFAAGDTVLVDGWVLARTEARLCALTALA